ncbi:MAG: stalk domain-containing protein, partial [bacterium]
MRPDVEYWRVVGALKELEKQAADPDSKALICWLIAKYSTPLFERGPGWSKVGLKFIEEARNLGIFYPDDELYDPIIRSYLQVEGKWKEVIGKMEGKELKAMIRKAKEELYRHFREYMRKAESYNPDITLFVLKTDDERVYYNLHIKSYDEFDAWLRAVEELESDREKEVKEKIIRGEVSPPPGCEKEWREAVERLKETGVFGIALIHELCPYVSFLWDDLADYYAWEGDYERAIYYKELRETTAPGEIGYLVTIYPPLKIQEDKLKEYRAKYLKKLKVGNVGDKLYPFIYVNDKPLDPRKGFTKGGRPFVSALPFLKALNISSEWTKEGRLLTIRRNDETLRIANIKGKWWVYKEGERKVIEAYPKEKEIYLPLKELCEILNLKLEWDE